MAERSLGIVGPLGLGSGAVRATANQTDPTAQVAAASYRVWQLPNNTGNIYVGDSTMNIADGTGQTGWVPAIQSPSVPILYYESAISVANGVGENIFDLSNVYVDFDNPTDMALVTYLEI